MESKITALEEEISILKGEIKSILQEVRTAILASENPFAGGSTRPAAFAIPAANEPAPLIPGPSPAAGPLAEPRRSFDPIDEPDAPATAHVAAGSRPGASSEKTTFEQRQEDRRPDQRFSSRGEAITRNTNATDRTDELGEKQPRSRVDVRSLAALAVWVEETRERLDDERLRIVLGLGRYGGLIDEELEAVLTEISAMVAAPAERGQASLNDCLVALRQLDAVMHDGDGSIQIQDRLRRSA